MNIETLSNDVHLHAKLARKELKAATKLEHRAQKEHAKLAKALRKGDIARAERHSTLEEELKAAAQQHKSRYETSSSAQSLSEYDLLAAQLNSSSSSSASAGWGSADSDWSERHDSGERKRESRGLSRSGSWKTKDEDRAMRGYNYSYPSDFKGNNTHRAAGGAAW